MTRFQLGPFDRLRVNGIRIALFAVLAACGNSKPKSDGGTPKPDAGLDGGADAGFDAGSADAGNDAGPPPVLTLTSLLPSRGESGGGTEVTILGSAFIQGIADQTATGAQKLTQLTFGGNPTLTFQVIDDNTIDAKVPPGVAGPADVVITNPNGSVTCKGCFTYFDPLFTQSVSPNNGPLRGGNTVTVTGGGFSSTAEVLFGGQSSPKITLVSTTQLQAVVPRGQAPGLVDVVVYSQDGIGTLRRSYQYFDDLRVSNVSPPVGPVDGGTVVTLTGKGFDNASAVSFGGAAATFTVQSSNQLTATAPAAATPGAVDVTITTPRDQWTVRKGFTYFDPAGGFAAFAVYPHLGPDTGGNVVNLTGQGLDAPGLTVSFGGQAATIVSQSPNAAQVQVPARGSAARVVDVAVSDGTTNLTLTGAYTYQLALLALAPDAGPSTGGTPATITGADLPPDPDVFIGALAATVSAGSTETQESVTTPPGSGGAPNDLWVHADSDPENEAVLPAAFTYDEPLKLGRVQPNRGAIAGGTLVSVVGAGFGDGTVVSFGGNIAKDIKVVDPHTLTCRTPRGDVGTVDVSATRLGQQDLAPGAYSYFDPASISGGLSGGPLEGSLNVSVIDVTPGFAGQPIPLANVMLGIDPYTPFQGQTDDRGQITFSDPSLVKAQTVTVWKDGYESTTVTAVTTENVTVLLTQTGGNGSPAPPPPGPPAAIITGRVTGFKAPRQLLSSESLEARVFVSEPAFYYGPPFGPHPDRTGEKWIVTTEGGDYLVASGAGVVATYAILGIKDSQTQSFSPFLMGIHRSVPANPDLPATGMDIVLDMHLDMTVPVTIQQPIEIDGGPATNSLYAWLDLGAEGLIPNPNNWDTGTADSTSILSTTPSMTFPSFPQLDGSNFIFLDVALGTSSYPQSLFYGRQPGDISQGLTLGPMLPTPVITDPTAATTAGGWDGTISWTVDPGPIPDIHEVLVLLPTIAGTVTLWTVVLPGNETTVTVPPAALQDFKTTYQGQTLFVAILSSRSPKFNYQQWTYDTLSGISWTSYTEALSDPFQP